MRRDRNSSAGFTLVEVLAVVLIIAIVVALVVGVSSTSIAQSKIRQTQMNMKTILSAVNAFQMNTGAYPTAGGDAATSSRTLFTQLSGNEKSRAFVGALPLNCTRTVGGNRMFLDEFDSPIRYVPTAGAGGGPLLESAGPDLNFSSATDNIRSDE